ncbi:MAG: NUDIX domain-containing protein [Candidatus Gracilibacteria bacterium]|nr:NUDIX domain-containing protein [Candidatus Gracilibacteria bacterium]
MADHLIDMVDENDIIIGSELKSRKPDLGFISRVVAIFLKDHDGKLIVCKRGSHKKLAAEKWDLAAFGNVDVGEDYTRSASRELKEELDITCELKMLDKIYQEIEHKGNKLKIFCGIFIGITDAEPRLNHEITEFKKMTLEEIDIELSLNPEDFCEGFVNDFKQVRDKLK